MSWREIQRKNFRKLDELALYLGLDSKLFGSRPRFPLNLPLRLAEKIEKNTLNDPILRQFVPLPEEAESPLGFAKDPVEDASFCRTDKLLQKYPGRALLLSTSACAMHCRYCFRQNFDYTEKTLFEKEIALIEEDASLHEVILSGGDPLSLSDKDLDQLLSKLGAIAHIELIRFHTRFPVGIPERITERFLQILADCPKQIVFLLHANHPLELDADVIAALNLIGKLGIPRLLQSVLLKGVNNNVETLRTLFLKSSAAGILPYYLHQLDKVWGTAHFEVSDAVGSALLETLRNQLPGYAVPRFVREVPGHESKTPIYP